MQYVSTRNQDRIFTSEDVLNLGLAPDGGLFVPKEFPSFTSVEIANLKNKDFKIIAFSILEKFLLDLFSSTEIRDIINEAYENFDEGIVSTTNLKDITLLNLFHGPTLAFKDYAMCLLAKIYEFYLKKNNKSLVVIGATSGDTGSAAIHAFQNLKNIKICILHPHNGTSEFQRKQMTTTGSENVFNIALEGTFDDCQSIVKKAFNDSELTQDQSFTAVNSINWFRILPQTIYYAWALSNHSFSNFVVPTGNFGNIYAAYILKKMGFPINNLVAATNENNILHRFISDNDLSLKKVLKTNSPSMDIVISSNFERLIHDFIGSEKTKDVFSNIGLKNNSLIIEDEDYTKIREFFKSGMASSLQVTEEIKRTFQTSHVVIDPHTAVGVSVARSLNLDNTCALACAHPIKFQETVIASIGDDNLVFDKSMSFNNSERYDILGNDYDVFKNYIIKNAKS